MARAIPTYQRQVLATGIQNAPNASSNVSANDPVASALSNLGQSVGNVANTMADEAVRDAAFQRQTLEKQAREQKEKLESEAAVSVQTVLSQRDLYDQENFVEKARAWKVGDPDLGKAIAADYDKWIADSTEKLPTDASKKYFQQHAVRMKTQQLKGAYEYQQKATTGKLDAESEAAVQIDENTVFNDPAKLKATYERWAGAYRARADLSEAQKIKGEDIYRRKLYLAVERGEMTRNPAEWYQKRFGSVPMAPGGALPGTQPGAPREVVSGFDAVVDQVFKAEGGYSASDGNTGAPVNFGINQRANPDIDVKNLTKDQARQIYKTRYWDAIGGDTLPPALQGTAMDAAVNQGPANAKRWIEASGGDPAKFNQLRREHYERLLEDPVNKKFAKTWLGRLAVYEGQAGAAPAPGAAPGAAPVPGSTVVPTAPASFTGMDYEQQLALKNQAETQIKQDGAVFKASVENSLRDRIAMHKDGIVDPNPVTPETFTRAFGFDADRMRIEYDKSRQMGADIGAMKTQSEAEIMASLKASEPVPGPGYAAQDERQRLRTQAAQQVLKARTDDPSGYATRNSSTLKGKQAELENPQLSADERARLTQSFVRDNLAEQQRLGIASPQVLTPRQADAIAMRAMSATRPEDSANLIAGLEAEYGQYFPQVFNQLVRENKIAGELLIIPNLPSQSAREAVSRLARVKETDLVQGIESADQKVVKDAVVSTLESFVKTVPMATQQAAGTVNAYETTLRKLSYQFMQSGMSARDAAAQAQIMLLGQYKFEGTTRYPKSVEIAPIERGTKVVLAKELDNIDVPRDLTGSRIGGEAGTEWRDTVRARGQWYTRQDDGGLELWAVGNNGVRYRVTRGGQGVSYTWEQLKATADRADEQARTLGSNARGRMREFNEQRRQDLLKFKQQNGID